MRSKPNGDDRLRRLAKARVRLSYDELALRILCAARELSGPITEDVERHATSVTREIQVSIIVQRALLNAEDCG